MCLWVGGRFRGGGGWGGGSGRGVGGGEGVEADRILLLLTDTSC